MNKNEMETCEFEIGLRTVSYFFFFAKLLHAKPKDASGEAACARNDGVSPRRKNKRLLTLLFCLAGDKEAVKVT